MRKLLLSIICSVLGLLCWTPVFAEEETGASIRISPISQYMTIMAGDVQDYAFKIENTGTKAFSFRVYTAPYNIIDDEYTPEFISETSYNQIARWISFLNDDGTYLTSAIHSVNPGEIVEVHYRVTMPDSIPNGSQQCVIFAETINEDVLSGTTSIKTISRVSHIVVGHGVGVTAEAGEILEYNLTGLFTRAGITASSKIANTGNTDFAAAYVFTVSNIFGKQIYEDAKNYTILPETERKFSSTWENAPLFGVFHVKYFVNANGTFKEKSHLVFIVPVFMLIIMLLLLTFIVIWIIILIRKRKERQSRLVL